MGSRGPIPNPNSSESKRGRNTLHRKQTGSPGKSSPVEPPDFILANPPAMAFWQKHAPALIAAKRLQPLQADCFAIICEQAAEVRVLSEAVAAEGLLIDTARGARPNPKVRLLRDARRDLLAAARGFGLDAASDARLPAEPPPRELSVIDKFRALKQSLSQVNPGDRDLTPEQRDALLYGTPAEKKAVTADVIDDRKMFA
jgi:phage terminase small subunit